MFLRDLTPSPCGHSPYLIYDEQRESVDTLIRFLCCGYLFNPSVLRTPPLYFAVQNTEEEFKSNPPFIADLIILFYSSSFCSCAVRLNFYIE